MSDALKIDTKDNVAVVIRPVEAGETLSYRDGDAEEKTVTAVTAIPIYHKIALTDMNEGEKVVKYGEHIGEASCTIKAGEHVHTHNVNSVREDLQEL